MKSKWWSGMCEFEATYVYIPRTNAYSRTFDLPPTELPQLRRAYRRCRFNLNRHVHPDHHEVYSPDDNGKVHVFPL